MTDTDVRTETPAPARRCWACGTEGGPNAEGGCPACGKIQSFPPDTDYFQALGLPRRAELDAAELERRWHALSRRFHPDYFRAGEPRERIVALENTALLNKAHRTLRDPFTRAQYLAELEGGGAEVPSSPPQALFEEILEIQELLMEHQTADGAEREALRPRLEEKRAQVQREYEEVARRLTEELFPRWDANDGEKAPLLAALREAVGNRAYLRRTLNGLEEALGG